MEVTKQVLEQATDLIGISLQNYAREINEAYLEADDDLSVGLKVSFRPLADGITVKVDLNFIASRVKDTAKRDLFPKDFGPLFDSTPAPREVPRTTEGGRRHARWYQHR